MFCSVINIKERLRLFDHLFVSYYFSPQQDLQNWIKGNVSKCERSLFIFEEIHKMPVGMMDGLKPFLDYHEHIEGVDYRYLLLVVS